MVFDSLEKKISFRNVPKKLLPQHISFRIGIARACSLEKKNEGGTEDDKPEGFARQSQTNHIR